MLTKASLNFSRTALFRIVIVRSLVLSRIRIYQTTSSYLHLFWRYEDHYGWLTKKFQTSCFFSKYLAWSTRNSILIKTPQESPFSGELSSKFELEILTNGSVFSRPYAQLIALLVQCCVRRTRSRLSSSSVTLCIVAKRCVLEQS